MPVPWAGTLQSRHPLPLSLLPAPAAPSASSAPRSPVQPTNNPYCQVNLPMALHTLRCGQERMRFYNTQFQGHQVTGNLWHTSSGLSDSTSASPQSTASSPLSRLPVNNSSFVLGGPINRNVLCVPASILYASRRFPIDLRHSMRACRTMEAGY